MQFALTGNSRQSEADGEAPEASDRRPMTTEPPGSSLTPCRSPDRSNDEDELFFPMQFPSVLYRHVFGRYAPN